MSIDECIAAYLSSSKRVFGKKAHRMNIKGKLQGRFDLSELKWSIKETITQCGLTADTMLKDELNASCKADSGAEIYMARVDANRFVCATSKEPSGIVNLTSFKSPHVCVDLLNRVKMWEACRATSAVSTFFDSIAVGHY